MSGDALALRESHRLEGWVGYGDFGAVGDGVTDDAAAIAATHAYANEHGLRVRADDHATYYLGGRACPAIIATSTDFGQARFLVDDTDVDDRTAPIFEVRTALAAPPAATFAGLTRLHCGQQRLPITLPTACLLVIIDSSVRHYVRRGLNRNAGSAQQDIVLVEPDGALDPDYPLLWDFDRISEVTAIPVDTDELRLSGGRFTTLANRDGDDHGYFARNIAIRRSRVVVEGLVHDIAGEGEQGAPYNGFLDVARCVDVMITRCTFAGHRVYSKIGAAGKPVPMGSYDLVVEEALGVTFHDCLQSNDITDPTFWGLFGSNYSKNLVLDGCRFSRFDAHRGVRNVTIRRSTLGYMGIHAIGEGTLRVEDTVVHGRYLLQLRPDYGSTWHGDVIIRNCAFTPVGRGDGACELIVGANDGTHDFGYPCTMPERIVIEQLRIDDAATSAGLAPVVLGDFDPARVGETGQGQPYPYALTREVVLREVSTASGREVELSANPTLFAGVGFEHGAPSDVR